MPIKSCRQSVSAQRGMRYTEIGLLLATPSNSLNPCLLNYMTSYEVASNIRQSFMRERRRSGRRRRPWRMRRRCWRLRRGRRRCGHARRQFAYAR